MAAGEAATSSKPRRQSRAILPEAISVVCGETQLELACNSDEKSEDGSGKFAVIGKLRTGQAVQCAAALIRCYSRLTILTRQLPDLVLAY